MTNVIETTSLTKRYGRRTAVDDLSIAVPVGVVAGFIGPNGAGKTTTMGMLLGLISPTAGDATVLGEPIADPARYLSRVGASIEGPALYRGLSGADNLRLLAIAGGHDRSDVPRLLDVVGLAARGDDRFGRYSTGMRQRLAIASALLGNPELLILDEPTNGLDPAAIHEMRGLITSLSAGGRTVFVSSHQLSELDQVCDWLVVIDDGRLVFQGPTAEFGGDHARLMIAPQSNDDIDHLRALVAAQGYAAAVEAGQVAVTGFEGDPRAVAAQLNLAAAANGIVLVEIHTERKNLEDRYLAVVNGSKVNETEVP